MLQYKCNIFRDTKIEGLTETARGRNLINVWPRAIGDILQAVTTVDELADCTVGWPILVMLWDTICPR